MRIFRDQTSVANAKFDQIDKRTVDFITPADDTAAIIATQSIDVRGAATDTALAVHPFDVPHHLTPELFPPASITIFATLASSIAPHARYTVPGEEYPPLVGNTF